MEPFVNQNGVEAKKQLSLIYMQTFLALPDPKNNLPKHTNYITVSLYNTIVALKEW